MPLFDIHALAATLPDTAATLLTDLRLTDEPAASCRIFRVHHPVPAHLHRTCDEYLFVLSGSARIVVEGEPAAVVHPGNLVFFRQGTPHSIPDLLAEPFTVLAVDTPRRPPDDIHFVNPADGTPETFIATQSLLP